MKTKLLIFSKGAALVPKNSISKVDIDGEEPIDQKEATTKNIKKHFKKPQEIIKIKKEIEQGKPTVSNGKKK